MKVKEPLPAEYGFFRENQIVYTYLHLAPEPELTKQLAEKKVAAVAYETIELDDGSLPLLRPMSEVAGRMAVQVGASCLEKARGGKGVLLGGVPGTRRGRVVILGGGVVGRNAATIAIGMGAQVTVLDVQADDDGATSRTSSAAPSRRSTRTPSTSSRPSRAPISSSAPSSSPARVRRSS